MILQNRIPYDVTQPRPLPGIAPLDMADWLIVDEAYAGQIAEKVRLLSEVRDRVLWLAEDAHDAAAELVELVLANLPDGFSRDGDSVLCPDGRRVTPDPDDQLGSLGQIVQEDLCLMVREGEEHVLKGAILCFPASWTLAEKAGRPLIGIHEPVADYDDNIARRVQRLFDGVREGRPLWRFNALWYAEPTLFHPRSENARRTPVDRSRAAYFRSERQSLVRLPRTGAVVFSIHTYVLARPDVPAGALET